MIRALPRNPFQLLVLSVLLLFASSVRAQSLPSGWSDQDIGNVGVSGSASYSNNVFTVTGAGSSLITGTADAFHFAYQPISGDATIVARIVSASQTNTQAAVMIRETLNSGATSMAVISQKYSSGAIYASYRTTTGGSLGYASASYAAWPYWVRLVRNGNTFTGYESSDGVNWVQVGSSQTINMAQNAYIGLAVTSATTSSSYSATFDNVSINTGASPAPTITSISATTGSVGGQITISGAGFGSTQGNSQVLLNNSSMTADSWSNSSIIITISTGAISGYLGVSVAPSMNDSNPVDFTVEVNPLPSTWLDQDIGHVGTAGTASYSSNVFTITGAGSSLVSGSTDGFHFAYQPISGDATILARVVSGSHTNAEAAVMIRETLNSGAMSMAVLDDDISTGTVYTSYRTATGGSLSSTSASYGGLPYWLKLVRSGNTFTGYESADGVNWVQIGSSEAINMAQNAYVGLAVTSQTTSPSYSATFDNVSVSTTTVPAPTITDVSATTATVGEQIVISGSGFGATQGSSQVLLNDAPMTVNSWSNSSITMTIAAGATSGYLAVSVAPSMNDTNVVQIDIEANPLPSDWLDQDIGAVGKAGSASYSNGAFSVSGAGKTFYGSSTSDGFHFAYEQLSGDGSIVARVVNVSSTTSTEAGVMICESLDSGSRLMAVILHANYSSPWVFADSRTVTGAASTNSSTTNISTPYWVKVTRSGKSFTAYISPDGTSWTIIAGPEPIDMAQNVYIGTVVDGESASNLSTATFDNVSVTTSANTAPQITGVSATTGSAGTQVVISGSGFGATQSSSVALLNDSPLTVSLWSSTEITVTIPSGATSGYMNVLLGPSMISSNSIYFTVTSQPLPSPWLDQDIGTVGKIGNATYASGAFTVQAGGTGVTGNADSFHFVYQPLTTDGSVVARVVSQSSGSEAGVMMRDALESHSAEVFTYFTASGSSSSEYMNSRTSEGGVVSAVGGTVEPLPYWVEVVRNANQFTTYVSSDGSNWYQIGAIQTLVTGQTVYVGLGVANNSTGSLATATFDNVSIGSGSSLPNPAVTGISPTTGAPGQTVTVSGSGFGSTQGTSTVQFNGATAAVSSWSDSQIIATVPDGASTGPVSVTVTGITAAGPTFTVSLAVQVTDSLGNHTSYTSGVNGGSWMIQNAQGSGCSTCTVRGNVQNQYDQNGNLAWTTDALGNLRGYSYDSNGNQTVAFVPLSDTSYAKTTYTYNSLGEVLTMTDPLGNVTTNTYDSHGNLLSVTTPAPRSGVSGSKTQFAYNSLGELTQITDPLNNITKITYTSAGYIQTITDPQNNVTTYGYDSRGNRTSVTDANNKTTTFSYDSGNRLTQITYPDQSTMSFGYDYRGRRTSVTDQNGKTTTYVYDDADRLTSVTDAETHTTTYNYDTEGNLLSITDANNNTTSFDYDAYGRVTQTTFPSTLYETYQYDSDNNLTSKTDRNGHTIQYVYDALNRLTQKSYPDSTSAEYTYDLVGKILSVNDPTGNYGFSYDNMGRLIGTTTTYSFLPNTTFTNSYSYDANSNRTGYTAPDNSTNTYTYDTLNRLTTLANSWAGSFGFSYDALSRRTQMTRPNGVATNYTYDNLSHLLSVLHQLSGSTIDGDVYTLDPAGKRSTKQDDLAGVTTTYGYDPISEVLSAIQGGTTTESYTYDPVGNRTASLAIPSYTVNTSNELTADSNASYTYDNNGNTLTKVVGSNTTSYAWDFENRLTSVTLPGTGGTVTFKYDPFGRRIEKISPTTTSIFVYDGDDLVETTNGSGGEVASYVQEDNIDQPLAMDRSGTIDYYEQDGLGSVTSLTASTGAVAQSYTYDSFGNTTNSSGSLTNFFRYTGREFDTETNLYYYRNRYYDPSTGRFLSEDPMQFAAGDPNLYRYVFNNPVNSVDPTGFFPTGKDKWWGHNDPNFRWWWHRCYWVNQPYDGTREEVEEGWVIWNGLGRPPKGKCGDNKPCKEPEPAPEPEPEPSPDSGPNWKAVGVGVGVVIVGVGVAVLCPECLVLAPAFAP